MPTDLVFSLAVPLSDISGDNSLSLFSKARIGSKLQTAKRTHTAAGTATTETTQHCARESA